MLENSQSDKVYDVFVPFGSAETRVSASVVNKAVIYYRFKIGGQRIYIDENNYKGTADDKLHFSQWYCVSMINLEDKKAYMILPPTSANDAPDHSRVVTFGIEDAGGNVDYINNNTVKGYTALIDYINTPCEAGRKILMPFQLYIQEDDANLGYYDTVLLAVNENFNHDEYKTFLKNTMGRKRDVETDGEKPTEIPSSKKDNYTIYEGMYSGKISVSFGQKGIEYGNIYNGEDANYILADAERCVCTPIRGDSDGEVAAEEFALNFSMMSASLGEKLEDNSINGFVCHKVKPFKNSVPQMCKDAFARVAALKGYKNKLQQIEKIESVAKFVPDSIAANAIAVANSRLYALWKSGVYVSKFNDYTNFSNTFDDEIESAEPWSSLSAGNASTLGEFVAIIPYGNKVLCFKDNCTMEVRGSTAPFSLITSSGVGAVGKNAVTDGGGYILFVGKDNVYMYTGSEPEALGDNLCLQEVTEACVVARDEYLYLCVRSEEKETPIADPVQKYSSYVFSMENGCWGRLELPTNETQFVNAKDGIYAIGKKENEYALYKLGQQFPEYWFFETNYMSGGTYEDIILSELHMIFDSFRGSWLKVGIRYYGEEDYTQIFYRRMNKKVEKEKVKINFKNKRCSGYQVKVEGSLYSCIYTLDITQRVVKAK